ncbi:MAG: hypothetical protein HY423_12720, partial [Candidatus Lambdaproteobacteria bacterium]|nr:hypothetical protein [Candidatus Lambdaproteobacteria bacterium]
ALKRRDAASLPDWNQLLIEKSYAILVKRRALAEQINGVLAALCSELTGGAAPLRLELVASLRGAREGWPAQVEQARAAELEAGHALVGPHRDDYRLSLGGPQGGVRAETQFSQGEYRAALLALELALNRLLSERPGFAPVLILDDLFSELDEGVRARVLDHLERLPNQIFITATEAPRHRGSAPAHRLTIEAGRIV